MPTTWDATYKSYEWVLSGSDLTATHDMGYDVAAGLYATTPRGLTGDYSFKVTINALAADESMVIGLGSRSGGLESGFYNNQHTMVVPDGAIWIYDWFYGALSHTLAAADIIEVRLVNGKVYYRVNSGLWNNNAGHDPAAGTGGYDISHLDGASALYPCVEGLKFGSKVTADFTAWDGVSAGITANAAITLGALSASSAGKLALKGSATATLGALTSTAVGKLSLKGVVAKTLGALTSTATGKLPLKANAAPTLGALAMSAASTIVTPGSGVTGTASITLGALASNATGKLPLRATAGLDLASMSMTAVGGLRITGASSAALGNLVAAATGKSSTRATLAASLANTSMAASAQLGPLGPIAGSFIAGLEGLTASIEVHGETYWTPTPWGLTPDQIGNHG